MKTIKIFCLHPYCYDVDSMLKYLQLTNLSTDYEFLWDDSNPDYLISTEHIYTTPKYRRLFNRLCRNETIIIFFSREAVSPDFNLCDYACCFDYDLIRRDRFVRLPGPFELYPAFVPIKENEITSVNSAKEELCKKSYFCNFLYSNPDAHPFRDELFYILSKYKHVDSLGRHLNNVGNDAKGYKGHELDCIQIKNKYKFSIASENACYDGYTSEKIVTSLIAHTIPIYFGDKHVVDNINPDCFINCNDFHDVNSLITHIRDIDNNDELWSKMVCSPWQTVKQIEEAKNRVIKYENFFRNVFLLDKKEAIRRPRGTFVDLYVEQFISKNIHKGCIFKRIKKRLNL